MHTTLRTFASVTGLSLGLAASAHAQTLLVNDNFTNAVRVGTGPITGLDRDGGTSNDWVVASNNTAMAGSAGGPLYVDAISSATGINGASLRVNNLGAFYDLKTHFASTTLAAGDSLTVSFNVRTSVANPTGSNGFRLGLYNSGGVLQTTSISTYNATTFDAYTGYTAQYTPNATGTTTTANSILERVSSVNQGLFQGTTNTLTNSGTPVVGGAVNFDTNYNVTFSITRSLDGTTNTLTSSFAGASIAATDASSPLATFDTLGIFFGSAWGAANPGSRANFIDDVVVTYTAAIPEPSAFAALAGLGALGLVATRRRARP